MFIQRKNCRITNENLSEKLFKWFDPFSSKNFPHFRKTPKPRWKIACAYSGSQNFPKLKSDYVTELVLSLSLVLRVFVCVGYTCAGKKSVDFLSKAFENSFLFLCWYWTEEALRVYELSPFSLLIAHIIAQTEKFCASKVPPAINFPGDTQRIIASLANSVTNPTMITDACLCWLLSFYFAHSATLSAFTSPLSLINRHSSLPTSSLLDSNFLIYASTHFHLMAAIFISSSTCFHFSCCYKDTPSAAACLCIEFFSLGLASIDIFSFFFLLSHSLRFVFFSSSSDVHRLGMKNDKISRNIFCWVLKRAKIL